MDTIDSMKRDKAYLKCKSIVKCWEKDFKSKHSRTPTRFDIKEAPSRIKYAYKKYFQLKSSALENSLSTYDFEEENALEFEYNFANENPVFNEPEKILPDLPSSQELENILSVSTSHNDVINKPKELHPFIDNLSKKLFKNSKFSPRNPRRPSLVKKIVPVVTTNIHNNDDKDKTNCSQGSPNSVVKNLQGFEKTITLNNIGLEPLEDTNTPLKPLISNQLNKSVAVRQLNQEWVKRATGFSPEKKVSDHIQNNLGISNLVLNSEKYPDYVENSESEEEIIISNGIKPALKRRKITENYGFPIINNSFEKNNSFDGSLKPEVTEVNSKRIKRKTRSASFCDEDNRTQLPDINDYLPFGLEEKLMPRYTNFSNINKTKIDKPKLEDEEHNKSVKSLQKKIKNGTLNDNFKKINIEKKVYARGKKHVNYTTYKKKLWKDKKALHGGMEFPDSGIISCFKCGNSGHMARYCTGQKSDKLLPLDSYSENQLPSLEDMQKTVLNKTTDSLFLSSSIYKASQIPTSFLEKLSEKLNNSLDLKPIYSSYPRSTPKELLLALEKFGHKMFRSGQEQTINRILCGMSTLLILSTGRGKSLCYQLPAYIYSQYFKCITLVISPLVSLMEDQVLSMPQFLKAGCLHTNQSQTQRQKIIQCLKDGDINILLVSPEALVSGEASGGFSGLFKILPPIAFACIDEAHCVSQWSHNFRPSYLMLCRVLREKLNVKCILGLTATASRTTIKSIIEHFNIPDGVEGVIENPTLPNNLRLSVSFAKDKDKTLISLITSDPIYKYNSIIVYCNRRDECERVAAVLRSCLQEPGKLTINRDDKKKKRMSFTAEAYHAGMSAAQRKKIQKHFMDGTLRIIVATVAFGMGINKSDIRCIIHYNMPGNFESYVQEVGRAGRDGEQADCHVLLNTKETDKNELLKHIHANSIDRATLRKLLRKVFVACECSPSNEPNSTSNSVRCQGHEIGIPIDAIVEDLDLPSENIATLLCYMELHPSHYIKVYNNAYTMCKISSYGGPAKILEAAKNSPPLAMAYVLENPTNVKIMEKSVIEFNVIEVAAAIGWESGMTKYHLKNLEWCTEANTVKRSQLKVEFNTLGFKIKALGDLSPLELDTMLDDLHKSVSSQEKAKLYQLEECYKTFSKIANSSLDTCFLTENQIEEKSNELKYIINDYFKRDENIPENIILEQRPIDVEKVQVDVSDLIYTYKDCKFTGKSIARIFQGISSPNYPAIVWGKCKYWRSHIHEDFYGLVKIATQQLLKMSRS